MGTLHGETGKLATVLLIALAVVATCEDRSATKGTHNKKA
jgi:hypothetical protein